MSQGRLDCSGFLEVMSLTCHPGLQSWAHRTPSYSSPVGKGEATFAGSLCFPPKLGFGLRPGREERLHRLRHLGFDHFFSRLLALAALRALSLRRVSWRRSDLGREAWEVEGWPCSKAARKRSGHPRVTTDCLRQLIQDLGMGARLGLPQMQPKELYPDCTRSYHRRV